MKHTIRNRCITKFSEHVKGLLTSYADFQSISISMNRFISRRFLVQTSKAVHATFASLDQARELRCREAFGVRRIPPLFVAQLARRARITNSSATTKAAGYAAPNASRHSVADPLLRSCTGARFPNASVETHFDDPNQRQEHGDDDAADNYSQEDNHDRLQ